jgi:NADPH:quinone reductase-like Zn-dependent oxidoreductase
MRAAVCERYGAPDVVVIKDVPVPDVGAGDVLVRVNVASVTVADARIRALRVPRGLYFPSRLALGVLRPRHAIFGLEVAGVVERVGGAVKAFKPGDRVVASRGFKLGGHAEFLLVREAGAIAKIPALVSDGDAVSHLFGGLTSSIFFERGKLQAGEHILVNGASGAVGVMAVQIAKLRGAVVTAVCSSANADLVRSLGADQVIDYAARDFTQDSARYDLVMDNVGNAPYARVKHLLKPGGRLLMVIGDLPQMLAASLRKNIVSSGGGNDVFNARYYRELLAMAEARQIKAVIGHSLRLEEIVEAHRIVDTGHKRGSVIVTVRHS